MNYKFSNNMNKVINEFQNKALREFENLPFGQTLKERVKPTKKKVFEFHLINYGIPIIKFYINNKFYCTYSYKNKEWIKSK